MTTVYSQAWFPQRTINVPLTDVLMVQRTHASVARERGSGTKLGVGVARDTAASPYRPSAENHVRLSRPAAPQEGSERVGGPRRRDRGIRRGQGAAARMRPLRRASTLLVACFLSSLPPNGRCWQVCLRREPVLIETSSKGSRREKNGPRYRSSELLGTFAEAARDCAEDTAKDS